MKYVKLTFLSFLLFSVTGMAQQKTSGKAIISTPGMYTEECKAKIEQSLFKQYGIVVYKADLKKKNVSVTWLTDRTDIEQIKTMIANVGFNADDVTAEETAFKRLSPACKTPPNPKIKKP